MLPPTSPVPSYVSSGVRVGKGVASFSLSYAAPSGCPLHPHYSATERNPFHLRAIDNATLTIPYLFPPMGHNASTILPQALRANTPCISRAWGPWLVCLAAVAPNGTFSPLQVTRLIGLGNPHVPVGDSGKLQDGPKPLRLYRDPRPWIGLPEAPWAP